MATKTIVSPKQETKVGAAGTKIYTSTATEYVTDASGKITDNKTSVYYYSNETGPNGLPAATTTDNGKTWTYSTYTDNGVTKTLFGVDAKKSLEQGALKTNVNQAIQVAGKKAGLNNKDQKSLSLTQNVATPVAGTNAENPQANFEDTTAGANAIKEFGQAIGDKDVRTEYGDYSYPKPFPEKQDRVKFSMFRYTPRSLDVDNFKTGDVFGSRPKPKENTKEIFGTVQLPITPQIQDTNSVGWGNDDMNAFAAMAASASYNIITKGGAAISQEANAIGTLLQSQGGNDAIKKAAAAYLAGEAAGGNKTFLTRVTGALINPNTELLFNGPQLRTFGFSFTMSAREPSEAAEIKKIIRFFKQGMSIKRASTNLFLKTPNIFDIKYILGDTNKDHPWINKIKTCALTTCMVNYTPAGNYATFYDGSMSAYEITLTFTELDPVFEDDYKNADGKLDDDSFIGY